MKFRSIRLILGCCRITLVIISFVAVSQNVVAQRDEPEQARATRAYSKREVRIPMRDGVQLHTTIYSPNNTERRYPILINRTPYGCNPYGTESRDPIMYNPHLVESGYIFVYQDLRSRSMSDGAPRFENLKPVYSQTDPAATDEVTDAADTIDWLLENVENHNDHVGMFGSSYMGYTSLMGAVTGHPNLKAVLAAAPSIDIYFEDFNRNGLFTLAYTPILDWFGTEKHARTTGPWWENNLDYWADRKRFGLAKDSYTFFLEKGSLKNFAGDLVPHDNYFWKAICEHPNYDDFRKQRDVRQYLRGIQCPVLIVGGWNDEQNLFGAVEAFRTIHRHNPNSDCRLVMGPWSHSGHKKTDDTGYLGDVYYGKRIVERYQRYVEYRFFQKQLKGRDTTDNPYLPLARLFDTGTNRWIDYRERDEIGWLVEQDLEVPMNRLALDEGFRLRATNKDFPESNPSSYAEYISDPSKPVPYIQDDQFRLFPAAEFMTADQRFASKRPDVLTFITEPLAEAMVVRGPLTARLLFSTDQTDADLIVKLIDVYPMDRVRKPTDLPDVKLNGYQQLVRCGQIRGRYRGSYQEPKPFVPNKPTSVEVPLLDVCHTFEKGHRVMVQIQSTLFPLFDRNPQKYVDNIYEADDADFTRATHRLYFESQLVWPRN